jgi:hypothetical protein
MLCRVRRHAERAFVFARLKRWTLGVVLAATVSLWGLVEADASPFSSYVLSDDLGNMVRGTAAEASDWEGESGGGDDGSAAGDSGGSGGSGDSAGGDSAGGDSGGDGTSGDASGKDNNGHGNNEDGVDSSNKGQGNGGPNGGIDESCPAGGECVDDEATGTSK